MEFCFTESARVPTVSAGKVKSTKVIKQWSALRDKLEDIIRQLTPDKLVSQFAALNDVTSDGDTLGQQLLAILGSRKHDDGPGADAKPQEETPDDIMNRLALEHKDDIKGWLELNPLNKLVIHHRAYRAMTYNVSNAVEDQLAANGKGASLLTDVIMPSIEAELPVKTEWATLGALCICSKEEAPNSDKPSQAAIKTMKSIFGNPHHDDPAPLAGHFAALRSRYIVRGLLNVLQAQAGLDKAEDDVRRMLEDLAKGDVSPTGFTLGDVNQQFAEWDIALSQNPKTRDTWSASWAAMLLDLSAQFASSSKSPADTINDIAIRLSAGTAELRRQIKQEVGGGQNAMNHPCPVPDISLGRNIDTVIGSFSQ